MIMLGLIEFIKKKQGRVSEELAGYIDRLAVYDKQYFYALYRKYWQKQKCLKIGENFIPSANLEDSQRRKELGVVDYSEIERDLSLADFTTKVDLVCNPMDAGIGSTLIRTNYLKRIWKKISRRGNFHLGTKGIDYILV